MKAGLAWDVAASENLGGGFVVMRRGDGESIIFASSLSDAGCVGLLTPTSVDARDETRLREWLAAWGFPADVRLVSANQVHGSTVAAASALRLDDPPDADGLWTDSPSDLLVLRTADCAPVWIGGRTIGRPEDVRLVILHAGWRGIADGIIEQGVRLARADTQRELRAAVGPCIGVECYEVGPEVADRFQRIEGAVHPPEVLQVPQRRVDSIALDLRWAIQASLIAAGVTERNLAVAHACTRCRADLFHSYRRNRPGGPLMAAIGAIVPPT